MSQSWLAIRDSRALIACAVVAFCVLIYIDLYPGKELDLFFLNVIIAAAAAPFAAAILLYRFLRRKRPALFLPSARSSAIAFAIVLAGAMMSATEIPVKIMFRLARGSFERYVQSGDAAAGKKQWLGIWKVIDAKVDDRGGTYIVTSTGHDIIDNISCGFAWKPNESGTPFGAAQYRKWKISGDWYGFYVTDDWF